MPPKYPHFARLALGPLQNSALAFQEHKDCSRAPWRYHPAKDTTAPRRSQRCLACAARRQWQCLPFPMRIGRIPPDTRRLWGTRGSPQQLWRLVPRLPKRRRRPSCACPSESVSQAFLQRHFFDSLAPTVLEFVPVVPIWGNIHLRICSLRGFDKELPPITTGLAEHQIFLVRGSSSQSLLPFED